MVTKERQQYDEIVAKRWASWRGDNFTWDGLITRKGPAHGLDDGITLQEYWRVNDKGHRRTDQEMIADSDLVLHGDQPRYHIIHLPLHYDDGTPTVKTSQPEWVAKRIEAIVTSKIAQSRHQIANFGGAVFTSYRASANHPVRAYFSRAMFCGPVEMQGMTFDDKVTFWDATFLDSANFNTTNFRGQLELNGVKFLGPTWFWKATIAHATFNGVYFHTDVDLIYSTFTEWFSCHGTTFCGRTRIHGSTFDCHTQFEDSAFLSEFGFEHSTFLKPFYFKNMDWPANALNHHGAFQKVTFSDYADFTGSGFQAFAAFDQATFDKGVNVDRQSEVKSDQSFKAELRSAKRSVRTFKEDGFGDYDVYNIDDSEQRLKELEAGCRLLKGEMAKQGDKLREQLLYKYELSCRREQPSTSKLEQAASFLYGELSDYGASILRPQIWLVIIFLVFAAIYGLMFEPGQLGWECWLMGAAVSASRTFPFGAFENVSKDFSEHIYSAGRPVSATIYMTLGTFQSFFALLLAFLTALAIRRRFQIN